MLDKKTRKKRSPIWMIDTKDFIKIVNSKNTLTEILAYFGLKMHGANNKTLKERINYEGIDISHIIESRKKLNKEHLSKIHNNNLIPLDEILVENSSYKVTHHLKNRLLKENLLKEECCECGLKPFWNGKDLSLHLDHENGKRHDNRIENLRLLCPNCHSQTKTYCGKAKRKYYICKECGGDRNKASVSGLCVTCSNKMRNSVFNPTRKVKNRPSKKELIQLILTKPFVQIGLDFDVSDNAIRKWCKSYDLPYRKKDIEQQKEQLEKMIQKELIYT